MIMAFEVLEHFANPSSDLDSLFERNATVLLISTGFYMNQAKDWWCFAPESGQHVFFYSAKALQFIGTEYGYDFVAAGGYTLFVKPGAFTAPREYLTKLFFRERFNRLVRSIMVFLPPPGVWRDHLLQRERAKVEVSSGESMS